MKKHSSSKRQLIGAIMLAIALVGSATIGVFADDEAVPVAKTYGVDPFDAEYSEGYFYSTDSENVFYSGFTESSGQHTANNRNKDENVYIDIYRGAHYNGKDLKVRIYTWAVKGGPSYKVSYNDGVINISDAGGGAVYVRQEYHFYEFDNSNAGPTISTSSAQPVDITQVVEIDFKGIFSVSDIDAWSVERYGFPNGCTGVWITEYSNDKMLLRQDDTLEELMWGNSHESSGSNLESWIWAEVRSSAISPLLVDYYSNGHSANIVAPSLVSVELNFPEANKEPVSKQIVKYGTLDLSNIEVTPQDETLELDGWYTSDRYEIKYPEKFMVEEDTVLYAKYTERKSPTTTDPDTPSIDDPSKPSTDEPSEATNKESKIEDSTKTSSTSSNTTSANTEVATRQTAAITTTTDTEDVPVPSTSSYVAPSTITYETATPTTVVSYPNTGYITKSNQNSSRNTLFDILRMALAIIGLVGISQIILSRRHKLRF
ncbi:hypothetical protein IKG48_00185 [Candidatus Saccharibacteria bacterium]|nr:hypothetical protein [Candidatus Saccharibacteria bacterium]